MEEEEIYDDGLTPTSPSGLSALKSRFEKPNPSLNKPSIGSKPVLSPKSANIAAKFGGGVSAGNKVTSSPVGQDKLKPVSGSGSKSDTVTSTSTDVPVRDKPGTTGAPSLAKRNSKVSIPDAFRSASDPPPPFDKPKPTVKPTIPKWKQKPDDSNNNKETVTNSNVSKHSKQTTDDSTTMLAKDTKPNGLPKKPIGLPSGNVKERANLLFGGASPSDLKSALKPVGGKVQDKSDRPDGSTHIPLTPKRTGSNASSSKVELREKFGGAQVKSKRKSVKSIVRSKDNKKFHKVEVEDIKSESSPPAKPDKLTAEIDWDKLATDFKKLLTELETSDGGFEEYEEEEYDDIANVRRETRAISVIQPLTEEEEQEWEANGFKGQKDSNDTLPPPPAGNKNKYQKAKPKEWLEPTEEEEYDDVGVLLHAQNGQGQDDDPEELYEPLPDEPLDSVPPPLQPKHSVDTNGTDAPPRPPPVEQIEKKDPKELEKERKRKEKEEKELQKKKEKEFKKKQEDLKHLMSKYKIDAQGLTQSVGKGTVRKSAKGTKKDLGVEAGDKVDIIRMVDNDKGKWLIRILDTEKDSTYSSKRRSRRIVGYVESTNVEVDTNIIRDVMEGSYVKHKFSTSSSVTSSVSVSEDDDEEMYEAVEGENGPEPIEEEIYEECN